MGARVSRQQVKIKHFFFGQVTSRESFNKELITWQKSILNSGQMAQWELKYKTAKSMKQDSLLLPESYAQEKIKKSFFICNCPADTEIAMTYENFDYMFKSEIVKRKQKKQFYELRQLFYIMYILLEGAKEFQIKGIPVGDIRPANIVKTKNKELKMINVASFPEECTSIEKILDKLDKKTVFYLAPEEIKFIREKGYSSDKVPNPKTQAFSIAITMIETCLLESSEQLYEMPKRDLKVPELMERMKKIDAKYPKIHKYISKIAELDPKNRLSTGEAFACLHPYSEKITELKQFSPKQSSEVEALKKFRKNNAF